MHDQVAHFIMTRCQRITPACSTPIKQVLSEFHSQLDASQRRQWGRTKFISELSREFKIIWDRSGRYAVAGLGLLPESQPRFANSHLVQ
jgi:hypothetical protein